jgi:hypothetical protein
LSDTFLAASSLIGTASRKPIDVATMATPADWSVPKIKLPRSVVKSGGK